MVLLHKGISWVQMDPGSSPLPQQHPAWYEETFPDLVGHGDSCCLTAPFQNLSTAVQGG